MPERWLLEAEIATYLGVNPEMICKRIVRKCMPVHKLSRLWKFLGLEVDEWIKGGCAAEEFKVTAPLMVENRGPTKIS